MLEPNFILALVSGAFSFAGGLFGAIGAMRSRLDTLAGAVEDLSEHVRESHSATQARCDRHNELISKTSERVAVVEREVVHFGDRLREHLREPTGVRGASALAMTPKKAAP